MKWTECINDGAGSCMGGTRLADHSSCLAVTASLGWLSIESHIDIKRLCYVHRLIRAEPISIARKLTVHVFMQMYIDKDISTYEGPIAVLYKTCKKYNLMDIVYNELFLVQLPCHLHVGKNVFITL